MLNHDFTFVLEHFQSILAPNLKKENSLEKTTIITWLPLIIHQAWLLWQLDFSYFLPTTETTERLKVLSSLVIKRGTDQDYFEKSKFLILNLYYSVCLNSLP